MKKLLALAAIGMFGLGIATSVHAGSDDAYPEIPNSCILVDNPEGPARVSHTPAGDVVGDPDCATLDVCVVWAAPADPGPSRMPHVESAEDCGDTPEACILLLDLTGPARAVHPAGPQPTPEPTPQVSDDPSVFIPQDCQAVLAESLAEAPQVPTVGSNNTPTILMASALVLTGGLLIIGQRRLARR